MRAGSRAKEYELRAEDVQPNSRFKDDGDGSFATTLVRALRRGASCLEKGNIHLQQDPTTR